MDVSTVKGIRYTYQIDYMNAEPTHLKSQVHNLPVVSEPQATALDSFQKQVDTYVPQRDTAVTYSAPTDASLSSPIARVSDNSIAGSLNNSTIPATAGVLRGTSDVLAPNGLNSLMPESEVAVAAPIAQENQIKLDIKTDELRPLEGVKPTLQTPIQNVRNGIGTEQNPIFQDNGVRLETNTVAPIEAPAPNVGIGLDSNAVNDGVQLNENAVNNNLNTADVSAVDNAERPVPSYMIPDADELAAAENETAPQNFNRFLANQAKALYGYISGAVSQISQGSFNVIA